MTDAAMTSPTAADAAWSPPVLPAATDAQKAKAAKVAHDFETSFLQIMMGQMFQGVSSGDFGGGKGEDAFKSFLTDSFAQSMAKHGGVGLATPLTHELLKMQGLSEGAPA
jgi:flagellar protein FlgJ